jgi:hypothetical protein
MTPMEREKAINNIAEEIVNNLFEFVEWIGIKGIERFTDDDDDDDPDRGVWYLYKRNSMEIEKEFHSVYELYAYWSKNIKVVESVDDTK